MSLLIKPKKRKDLIKIMDILSENRILISTDLGNAEIYVLENQHTDEEKISVILSNFDYEITETLPWHKKYNKKGQNI